MNDAQLFVIFSAILGFGWLGFWAGKEWESPDEKVWTFPVIVGFFLGSIGLSIATAINLIALVAKNY